VVGSKRLLKNANWARYNLAVSRRKETEPSSSAMWNLHLPGDPAVDFHKFFDGENITQQDLVAWINLGMHHLVRPFPNTYSRRPSHSTPLNHDSLKPKIPQTQRPILQPPGGSFLGKITRSILNYSASLAAFSLRPSFILTPLNYFDYDISMELKNSILLHPSDPEQEGDPYSFDDNGVKQDFTCAPEPPIPFDYSRPQLLTSDGSHSDIDASDLRQMSEMYLRVKIGS